jgi:hypothetical protein
LTEDEYIRYYNREPHVQQQGWYPSRRSLGVLR